MTEFLRDNRKFVILFLIAVSIRFVNIGMPILEGTATRQTQTAMIARNLYEKGFDVMHPEVDHLGPGTTHLILEFPLLNVMTAFGYQIAGGVNEWIGRSLSILFFAGSLLFLYLLVLKLFDKETAFWASVVYSFSPLSIIFSRAFMPDFEMLFFSIGSIYLMYNYFEKGKMSCLFLSAVLFMLALLSKVQSFYVAIPLSYLVYKRDGFRMFAKPRNWAALIIGVLLPALWYIRASGIQVSTTPAEAYNYNIFHWIRFSEFLSLEFYKDIFRIYPGIFLTPVGLILFIVGLFVKTGRRGRFLYAWIAGAAIFFILLASKVDDPYYNLAVLPVASVVVARGFMFLKGYSRLKWRTAAAKTTVICVMVITGLFIARYGIYYAYIVPRGYKYIPEGAAVMREISAPEDLVIASSAGGPAALYYCDRKGRPFLIPSGKGESTQKAIDLFEEYRAEGNSYYFCPVMRELNGSPAFKKYLYDNYELIASEDDKYVIFKI